MEKMENYRIEPVKSTGDAAYNYGKALRDAIKALYEAEWWLRRMAESGMPDSLPGSDNDREWAKGKLEEVHALAEQANFVKYGRKGIMQA